MKNSLSPLFLILLFYFFKNDAAAQQQKQPGKCGNEKLLKNFLSKRADAEKRFHESEKRIAGKMLELQKKHQFNREQAIITIPVVFHIILPNTSVVKDADIASQLKVLNDDYAGLNADSTKIPAAFKSLFAKSNIRFCLAQRNPEGEPSTGIERVESSAVSNHNAGDPVKHKNSGGANAWDPSKYLNMWVAFFNDATLGYSSIPGENIFPEDEDGVVIDYRTLPGSALPHYNLGRTAVHEAGHYFRLYHIWGDDDGTCNGSDFPDAPAMDDTPNQANETGGCPSVEIKDACSPNSPGIMYQNYMDYTDDACMVMFSNGQAARMDAALSLFRPGLLTSDGCTPVTLFTRNVKAVKIEAPGSFICTGSFQPAINIKNLGNTPLTSLQITTKVDDGTVTGTTNWTGNLASLASTSITLNSVAGVTSGNHSLTIFTSLPNGAADENVLNDTAKSNFVFPVTTSTNIKEGFENTAYPPQGWSVDNPDGELTWERTTLAAKTGAASVRMHNFEYAVNNERDNLITPIFPLITVDSTFLTFQLAAVTYSSPSSPGGSFDTLEVLVTTDCGATYKSVYKKSGAALITSSTKTDGYEEDFIPLKNEWRKDSVYLTPYLTGALQLQVVFKNTSNFENNIYLDDINLYNYYINPLLKQKGLLITPNPFNQSFFIQHYPAPQTLKAAAVYNSLGQLIMQRNFAAGQAPALIEFNLAGKQTGMYYVKVFYTNRTVTQKILKTN